jgi:hypothetical protein
MNRLTYAEVRRLMEGKRVHQKMQELARENDRHDGAALGRAVPRESDEELLADYAGRMDRGEVGQNAVGGA